MLSRIIEKEVAALENMTVGQLQNRYVDVFGEPIRGRYMQFMIFRIGWRLPANAACGLTERALCRPEEPAAV